MKIRKLDMALEQFEDALRVYFSGRYYSAIVLAGAAEELLAAHIHALAKQRVRSSTGGADMEDLKPAYHSDKEAILKFATLLLAQRDGKPIDEREVADSLNYAYNHAKHAGTKSLTVEFDLGARAEAEQILDRVRRNLDALNVPQAHGGPLATLITRFVDEAIVGIDYQQSHAPPS